MESPAMTANTKETAAQMTMCWRSISRPPMDSIHSTKKAGRLKDVSLMTESTVTRMTWGVM